MKVNLKAEPGLAAGVIMNWLRWHGRQWNGYAAPGGSIYLMVPFQLPSRKTVRGCLRFSDHPPGLRFRGRPHSWSFHGGFEGGALEQWLASVVGPALGLSLIPPGFTGRVVDDVPERIEESGVNLLEVGLDFWNAGPVRRAVVEPAEDPEFDPKELDLSFWLGET